MSDLLLVEDDDALADSLASALTRSRHTVHRCADGASAIAAAGLNASYDLVVLDLGLPDLDGVDVCRAIRQRMPDVVIVILTARDTEVDVVVGLEAGADDYLSKPIRSAELLARIRAHLRRASSSKSSARTDVRVIGPLRIDESTRQCWIGDHELRLRTKHFDLLARLTADPGAAVSREILMAEVWDEHWFGSTKTLDVHIAGLRRWLSDAAHTAGVDAPEIVTLRGFGYRIQPAGRSGYLPGEA